jgi:hypothetical protein
LEIHCENCEARFVAYYGTEENVDTETLDVLTRRSGEEIRAAPEGAEGVFGGFSPPHFLQNLDPGELATAHYGHLSSSWLRTQRNRPHQRDSRYCIWRSA